MLSRSAIDAAATRLGRHIRHTPILQTDGATLKLEFLQRTGSFKARGAFNRLLTADVPAAGVAAASGGNHGAAVAYAAQRLGHQARIFVPAATPAAKVERIQSYGASIVQGGTAYAEALAACEAEQAATGAMGVHAYDDPAVLAGQGTVGREFDHDAPGLTHVLVAIGGGGLIGGIASWYAGSGTAVVGVEPEGCPTMHAALRAGQPVRVAVGGLASDSLGAGIIGSLAFEVAAATGMRTVLVSEAAIRAAQAWLWTELRIISEPGGAAALAALQSGAWTPPARARVGVVLCGANTTL